MNAERCGHHDAHGRRCLVIAGTHDSEGHIYRREDRPRVSLAQIAVSPEPGGA